MKIRSIALLVLSSSTLLFLSHNSLADDALPKARYVRISLQGTQRVLTLAEVEVISEGKNIAPTGKTSQSSVGSGGVPERAIDGNKDPDYSKKGQTHSAEGKDDEPWWELDLGAVHPIESIQIWNRAGFAERLQGFRLDLLKENRQAVLSLENNPAPDGSVQIRFGQEAKLAFFSHQGDPMPVPIVPDPVPEGYRDPESFAFSTGDHVALLGNGLADRMQHDGWTETWLQVANPDAQLVFRNLAVTGDKVGHYPREKGFTPMADYLRLVKADVIFAFFGYNESFAGSAGLPDFEKNLSKMIQDLREARPSKVGSGGGESGRSSDTKANKAKNIDPAAGIPRIVLFSPIAHEDLKDPNLPDGVENNQRLALYTAAMQKVAQHEGVAFVNLFEPTKRLYEEEKEALTINGVHLNEKGNRLVGKVITEALNGHSLSVDEAKLSAVREAVLDKNWYWHNRYRAVDGNDIWGTRSTLTFVNDQSNGEVLQHELNMLDVAAANRDPRIWARAQGKDAEIDDSNIPAAIPVVSNVGGGSKSSSAEKEGSLEYLDGEQGIAKMKVPEGFQVNLFADEKRFPELANPVQMQVDGQGRLWAAVWRTYPKWEPKKPMDDALLIFTDEDGDGVADRCVEFARVHCPLGFEFWNGGVIVTSQPNLLFLKDTDGDGVADERYVLFQGTDSADTHHAANNLIYGPDGGIYWQSGIFMQHNFEHPWGPSVEATASGMYRFDPRRYTIAFHADNSPNPHGISFDDWGYHYANDGTSGRSYQVVPDPETKRFRMRELLTKQVRPVAADEIVSSTNFPDEMQGDFLICNTIGFLGIKRYQLHREGYKDAEHEFGFGEVWGTPAEDLLVSEDKNFRPTDAIFGADGALYVSDWQNVIIGHMQHNIRDPNRDKKHGRIYRMIYKGRPLQKPVAIAGASIPELLENFRHPSNGVHQRTRVELSARPTVEVIAATEKWRENLDPKNEKDARLLLEALWVHQQHNVRNRPLLDLLLQSPVRHAAIAAETVRYHWDVADPAKNLVSAPIQQKEESIKIEIPSGFSDADAKLYRIGSEVFHRDAHCVTCHQADGKGIAGIYPPLVDSPWVKGNADRLIKLTLHGLWGPLELNGSHYDPAKGVPPMTAFKSLLKDEEIAGVLTYVRYSWGNRAPALSSDQVAKVREATKGVETFLKPEDLLKEYPMEP